MTDRRPVLSAFQLGITPAEHKALLEVRELFANGAFHHDWNQDHDRPNGFNMECFFNERSCGTTACIGGWMWALMKRDGETQALTGHRYVKYDRSLALKNLFWPPHEDIDDMSYDDITPGAALLAIDSFLATGNPNWQHAVGADVAVEVRDDA
ncbi:hypothetical protein [Bradyrhizobium sp. SZCCHNRI2010]|uniref:hypothetical protein n=1 Tax=Bradyrhizobium sp. SZCCHNRI2010 TaxID=3057283 RepID=UPI0028E38F05|nr:hypothetical protein [Bradyrhizobium sp. SZCCHNRI2010]